MARETVFVGLGSNLGDRSAHIHAASEAMARLPETELLAIAPVIETAPVGPVAQGPFLNTVAMLSTGLEPRALLEALQAVERSRGRDRADGRRWGPRTLDLDILLFGERAIDEPGLVVPHPRLAERAFVLEPLAGLAPELRVPGTGQTATELLCSLRAEDATREPT